MLRDIYKGAVIGSTVSLIWKVISLSDIDESEALRSEEKALEANCISD